MKRLAAALACLLSLLIFSPCGMANALSGEVYLTFDDGPSREYTPAILDALKSHGVKATFFVVGKSVRANGDILRRMRQEGHSIGVHCDEHVYAKIYKNYPAFSKDLKKCIDTVERTLPGYKVKYYRFPGGSFGKSDRIIRIVKGMGLEIVDWNCVNGDTEIKNAGEREILSCVKSTSKGKKKAVILMHDNKGITARTLPAVIKYFKQKGYRFKKFA